MHSEFDVVTGEFTGRRMMGSPELLQINTVAGCAWAAGEHDPRRCVVCLVTDDMGDQQTVVSMRLPAKPADTELQTWHWDAAADDWRATPTLRLLQARATPPVLAQLATLDLQLARPLGELMQAQALGEPLPPAAVARLQAVNADKALLRARLAAIAASTTREQLAALLAEPFVLQTVNP